VIRLGLRNPRKIDRQILSNNNHSIPSSQSTINIQIHHFKTTFMCPRSIAGVPSSQALPGFLVIGALAVWRQNIKHEKKSHWNKYTIGKKHVFEYCARWGYYPRLSGRRSDLMRGDKQTFSFKKKLPRAGWPIRLALVRGTPREVDVISVQQC